MRLSGLWSVGLQWNFFFNPISTAIEALCVLPGRRNSLRDHREKKRDLHTLASCSFNAILGHSQETGNDVANVLTYITVTYLTITVIILCNSIRSWFLQCFIIWLLNIY